MRLIIEVGAVGLPSLTGVFRSLPAASAAAQQAVKAQWAQTGQHAAKAAQQGTTAAKQAGDVQAGLIRSIQALRDKDHARVLGQIGEVEREQKRAVAAVSAERKKLDGRNESVGSAAHRTFGTLVRGGVQVAGKAASAFGADADPFAAMGRSLATHDVAGKATRNAFAAQGRTAVESDIGASVDTIQKAGDLAKLGYGDMAQGFDAFLAKSSDLDTARATLGKMGVIAQATGASVKDLMSSAGDVNRELADGPDKAERLLSIMRLVAKQTAMGNVEAADLAKYMPRIAATAFMYQGSKDKNIGILGALAQVSMKGGASSAAEATRSAAAFARDLTKAPTLKAFDRAGIDVFADKSKTKIRGPEAIITDFLQKSNGDMAQLSTLFKNDASRKAVLGFANIYSSAGGGKKGLDAVHGEFSRYSQTMSEADVNAQAKTALDSPTARAQVFNNEMEKLGGEMAHELGPALQKLSPVILDATRAFTGLLTIGANNPGMAITAAVTASIAKAALGEAVGKALSGAVGGMAGGGLVFGAASIAIMAATIAVSNLGKGADKGHAQVNTDEKQLQAIEGEFNKTGMVSAANMAILAEMKERKKREKELGAEGIEAGDGGKLDGMKQGAARAWEWLSTDKSMDDIGEASAYKERMGNVTSQEKGIDALIRAMTAKDKDGKPAPTAGEIGSAVASALAPMINTGGAAPVAQPGSGGVP